MKHIEYLIGETPIVIRRFAPEESAEKCWNWLQTWVAEHTPYGTFRLVDSEDQSSLVLEEPTEA